MKSIEDIVKDINSSARSKLPEGIRELVRVAADLKTLAENIARITKPIDEVLPILAKEGGLPALEEYKRYRENLNLRSESGIKKNEILDKITAAIKNMQLDTLIISDEFKSTHNIEEVITRLVSVDGANALNKYHTEMQQHIQKLLDKELSEAQKPKMQYETLQRTAQTNKEKIETLKSEIIRLETRPSATAAQPISASPQETLVPPSAPPLEEGEIPTAPPLAEGEIPSAPTAPPFGAPTASPLSRTSSPLTQSRPVISAGRTTPAATQGGTLMEQLQQGRTLRKTVPDVKTSLEIKNAEPAPATPANLSDDDDWDANDAAAPVTVHVDQSVIANRLRGVFTPQTPKNTTPKTEDDLKQTVRTTALSIAERATEIKKAKAYTQELIAQEKSLVTEQNVLIDALENKIRRLNGNPENPPVIIDEKNPVEAVKKTDDIIVDLLITIDVIEDKKSLFYKSFQTVCPRAENLMKTTTLAIIQEAKEKLVKDGKEAVATAIDYRQSQGGHLGEALTSLELYEPDIARKIAERFYNSLNPSDKTQIQGLYVQNKNAIEQKNAEEKTTKENQEKVLKEERAIALRHILEAPGEAENAIIRQFMANIATEKQAVQQDLNTLQHPGQAAPVRIVVQSSIAQPVVTPQTAAVVPQAIAQPVVTPPTPAVVAPSASVNVETEARFISQVTEARALQIQLNGVPSGRPPAQADKAWWQNQANAIPLLQGLKEQVRKRNLAVSEELAVRTAAAASPDVKFISQVTEARALQIQLNGVPSGRPPAQADKAWWQNQANAIPLLEGLREQVRKRNVAVSTELAASSGLSLSIDWPIVSAPASSVASAANTRESVTTTPPVAPTAPLATTPVVPLAPAAAPEAPPFAPEAPPLAPEGPVFALPVRPVVRPARPVVTTPIVTTPVVPPVVTTPVVPPVVTTPVVPPVVTTPVAQPSSTQAERSTSGRNPEFLARLAAAQAQVRPPIAPPTASARNLSSPTARSPMANANSTPSSSANTPSASTTPPAATPAQEQRPLGTAALRAKMEAALGPLKPPPKPK